MGNFVSEHYCPLCRNWEFEPPKPHCEWCTSFLQNLSASAKSTTYQLKDANPARFHGVDSSFVGPIEEKHQTGGIKVAVFGRGQNSTKVEDIGGWYHLFPKKYPGSASHDLAILEEWGNEGKCLVEIAVPVDIRWLQGKAASQHTYESGFKPGGGDQVYIPPEIAKILYVAGQLFLQNPSKSSYKAFKKACAPAYELQDKWLKPFREIENEEKRVAKIYNDKLKQEQVEAAVRVAAKNKKLQIEAQLKIKLEREDAERVRTIKQDISECRDVLIVSMQRMMSQQAHSSEDAWRLFKAMNKSREACILTYQCMNEKLRNELFQEADKLSGDFERFVHHLRDVYGLDKSGTFKIDKMAGLYVKANPTKGDNFPNLPKDIQRHFTGEAHVEALGVVVKKDKEPDKTPRKFCLDNSLHNCVVTVIITFDHIDETVDKIIYWYRVKTIVK